MIFIGIDPGVSGGIAFLSDHNPHGRYPMVHKMPETERDLLDVLRAGTFGMSGAVKAVLERVNAGVFGKAGRMGVTSAFTFGRGVGRLEMALTAANIPFDYASANVWQKVMGCLSKGDKNVTKRRAQQLFPTVTVTHAVADALLLAEYCRRVEKGGSA